MGKSGIIAHKISIKQSSTMELKVRSKVFYPSHGAGWVKAKKRIEFNGEKKDYFEFEFINNPLTISTPIENIDKLGIREVYSPALIRKKVSSLKKTKSKNPKTEDFNALANMLKELEEKGEIEDFVQIIQYCNSIRNKRIKDGRLIPVSIDKQLSSAIENIVGELAVSADMDYTKAYLSFQRSTGIKAEE
jgi:CarD family transcriptional regulator